MDSVPLFKNNDADNFRSDVAMIITSVLKAMLKHVDDVKVNYEMGPRTTVFKVHCHREDYGQLLGKQGRNIEGLRRITTAMMSKHAHRAVIEIPYVKKEEMAA
ncbi:MAG: KH domain-containing protein [Bdellovibrio sp.]